MRLLNSSGRQRLVVYALIVYVAPVMQTGVLNRTRVGGHVPDLVLCAVLAWGLLTGAIETLILAFAAGVVLDVVAGNPVGLSALALIFSAGLASIYRIGIPRSNPFLQATVFFSATLLYYSLLVLVVDSLDARVAWVDTILADALPAGLLNVLVAMLCLEAFRRIAPDAATSQLADGTPTVARPTTRRK